VAVDGDVEVAVLSPLAVTPARQRRGIGSATTYEPWMTGTLVYSRVVWEHDVVGLRDPAA
jgi:hypothetical protein